MAVTTTLLTLQTRIGARLKDPAFQSVALSDVTDVLNQSLEFYKYRRFWFNDKEADITLTQGQPVIPNIPADFLQELPEGGLTIAYSTVFYPLEKRTSQVFDNENVEGVGLPYCYTYRAQQFEVYFYPNIAYLLKFRYLKDYPALAAGSDTNDFLNFADMMIYYDAMSRIYGEFKEDKDMESYYTARAANEMQNVMLRSSHLTGTGSLVLNSNLLS